MKPTRNGNRGLCARLAALALILAAPLPAFAGDLLTPSAWIRVQDNAPMEAMKDYQCLRRYYVFEIEKCSPVTAGMAVMRYNLYEALISTSTANAHAIDPFLYPIPPKYLPAGNVLGSWSGPYAAFTFSGAVHMQDLVQLQAQGLVKVALLHLLHSGVDEVGECSPRQRIPPNPPFTMDPCAFGTNPLPGFQEKAFVNARFVQVGDLPVPVYVHLFSHDPDGDPAITTWNPRGSIDPDGDPAKPIYYSIPQLPNPLGDDPCGTPWSRGGLNLNGAISVMFVQDANYNSLKNYLVNSK